MIPKYDLNAEEIRKMTQETIQNHLSLTVKGYRCTSEMIVDVLLKAASDGSSVEATCADLANTADSNTIRETLNMQFDVGDLREQEIELNQALAAHLPHQMRQGKVEVAIDFHDEPFYGKSSELRTYAVRDSAKKGTTHFYRIASAYVIWRRMRVTLAVMYVLPEHNTLYVLAKLMHRIAHLQLQVAVLYLDKGFCSGAVIQYLQQRQQPTIIACPIRGKTGGTKALCCGRKSYRTNYTFTDGTQVDIMMVATLPKRHHGKRARKWLAYVVIGLDNWTPQKVKRQYRRRFGIECSYRQLRQIRIHTNSRNPAFRFFVLGFALLLITIWARIRWLFCRVKGPGRPRIDETLLRLHRFVNMIRRMVEAIYGVTMMIPTYCSPQSVIY